MNKCDDDDNDAKYNQNISKKLDNKLHYYPCYNFCIKLYCVICIFRICNSLIIQTYFDPDEYWQSLEPAYCRIFNNSNNNNNSTSAINEKNYDCPGFTWEWKTTFPSTSTLNHYHKGPSSSLSSFEYYKNMIQYGPNRSYTSIIPIYYLYYIVDRLGVDSNFMIAKGPHILYAILVASIIDICVYIISYFITMKVLLQRNEATIINKKKINRNINKDNNNSKKNNKEKIENENIINSRRITINKKNNSKNNVHSNTTNISDDDYAKRNEKKTKNPLIIDSDKDPGVDRLSFCSNIYLLPFICLFLNISNWFHAYTLVRTYSNCLEAMLLLVGFTLILPEFFNFDNNLHNNCNSSNNSENSRSHSGEKDDYHYHLNRFSSSSSSRSSSSLVRTSITFLLGGLCVAIRFSSIVVWIPIGIMLTINKNYYNNNTNNNGDDSFYDDNDDDNSSSSRLSLLLNNEKNIKMIKATKYIQYILFPCAFFGFIGSVLIPCIFIDYYFYGFYTLPFLSNIHFNVILGLSSLYGTHSWHWYVTAGIPASTGLLLPFIIYDFFVTLLITKKSDKDHEEENNNNNNTSLNDNNFNHDDGNMMRTEEEMIDMIVRVKYRLWIIVLSYVSFHSFSPHKEFRFLLPILPFLTILGAIPLMQFFSWLFLKKIIIRKKKETKKEESPPTTVVVLTKIADNNNVICDSKTCTTTSNSISSNSNHRNKFLIAAIAFTYFIINLIPVLYLGLFHQGAPIAVNKEIVRLVKNQIKSKDENENRTAMPAETTAMANARHTNNNGNNYDYRYSIHYLTGSCHSTPVHSQLHIPINGILDYKKRNSNFNGSISNVFGFNHLNHYHHVHFDTWSLDCSPNCRSDPSTLCETEQFNQDPINFIKGAYGINKKGSKEEVIIKEEEEKKCRIANLSYCSIDNDTSSRNDAEATGTCKNCTADSDIDENTTLKFQKNSRKEIERKKTQQSDNNDKVRSFPNYLVLMSKDVIALQLSELFKERKQIFNAKLVGNYFHMIENIQIRRTKSESPWWSFLSPLYHGDTALFSVKKKSHNYDYQICKETTDCEDSFASYSNKYIISLLGDYLEVDIEFEEMVLFERI